MFLRVLGVLILLIVTFSMRAQVMDWGVLSLDSGLSDTKCFDVFADSKGYIWIGTRAGIDRYDGKDVVSFDRSTGLLCDNVFSCFEDTNGRIWINNLNGEPVFIQDGIVHNRFTDPYLESLRTATFKTCISEDSLGRIYFSSQSDGLLVLDQDTVFRFDLGEDMTESIVYAMLEWRGGLALLHDGGMSYYDDDYNIQGSFKMERATGQRACVIGDRLFFSRGGRLFSYSWPELSMLELPLFDENLLISDLRNIDGLLHISTSNGVFRFVDGHYDNHDLERFDDMFIAAIDKGPDGRIWVASRDRGVYFQKPTVVAPSRFFDFKGISYIQKYGEDSLYVGYNSNKLRLETGGKRFDYALEGSDALNVINTMKVNGEIWMSNSVRLSKLNAGIDFEFYKRDGIYSERYDRFFFTVQNGILHGNSKTLLEGHAQIATGDLEIRDLLRRIPLRQAYKCAVDSRGVVWIGCQSGLVSVVDTVITHIDNLTLEGSVIDIAIEDDLVHGISFGNGLFLYDAGRDTTVLVTQDQGLPSLNITNLCVSGVDIWVTHSLGISQLRRDGYDVQVVKNYGYGHGVPVGDISYMEYINGELIFVVDECSYTLLEAHDVEDSLSLIFNSEPLVAFVDEEVRVVYDCINYSFGDNISYDYRVLPLDSTWMTTGDEMISLRYLPTGSYTLEVRASHPLDLNSNVSVKSISIIDRWYNTLWFRTLLVFFAVALVWFLMRLEVLQINYDRIVMLWRKTFAAKELPPLKIKDINGVIKIVNITDIIYVKAAGNYVEYITDSEAITVRCTMTNTISTLSRYTNLIRVHRSYIANLDRLKGIGNSTLDIEEQSVPFSATYKEDIDRYVGYLTT